MGLQNPFARRRLIGRNGRILNRGRLGRPVGAFRFSDLFESRWKLALFSADKLASLTVPEATTAIGGYAASYSPSLLPRPWYWQGLVAGLGTMFGYQSGLLLSWTISAVAEKLGVEVTIKPGLRQGGMLAGATIAGLGTIAIPLRSLRWHRKNADYVRQARPGRVLGGGLGSCRLWRLLLADGPVEGHTVADQPARGTPAPPVRVWAGCPTDLHAGGAGHDPGGARPGHPARGRRCGHHGFGQGRPSYPRQCLPAHHPAALRQRRIAGQVGRSRPTGQAVHLRGAVPRAHRGGAGRTGPATGPRLRVHERSRSGRGDPNGARRTRPDGCLVAQGDPGGHYDRARQRQRVEHLGVRVPHAR